MAKGILLWPNAVDDQITPPTFSGGRWRADAPIEWVRDDGVQTGYLAFAAEFDTTEPTDTTFTIDHGQQVPAKAAVLLGNFGVDAEITLERSSVADFSTLVASVTKPVYPVIYPLGTQPAYSPNFISGKPIRRIPKMPWAGVFDTVHLARYSRFSITDPTNPDGFVSVSRAFIAGGYEPFFNMNYGAALKPVNRTRLVETIAGARVADVRTMMRQWELTYEFIPQAELWANLWELQAQLGVSMQAFFLFDPDDTANIHRHSYLCTLAEPSGVVLSNPGRGGGRLMLPEVIA
ncbi:MAG: hypothetical protein ACMVO3_22635 [Thalassobaculum sp.]